jgi:hypothetical protein
MRKLNTALIAEYLALLNFQPASPTEAEYRYMNQLALQLSMETPDDVLAVLFRKDRTGTYQDAWDVVDAVRRHTCPGDPRDREHSTIHRLGAGNAAVRN